MSYSVAMVSGRLVWLVLLLWLSHTAGGRAEVTSAEPSSIHDYDHVAWTSREGAPAGIWAMAQSQDGWIWLGTSSGLFRFDGVNFERADLLPAGIRRSRSIAFISPMASGDLWVAYASGGASVRPARSPAAPFTPPGLPEGTLLDAIVDAGDGDVWGKSGNILYVFDGRKWHPMDGAVVKLPENCDTLVPDRSGNLWASSSAGLWLRRSGTKQFEPFKLGEEFGYRAVVTRRGEVFQRRPQGFAKLSLPPGLMGNAVPTSSISASRIDLVDGDGVWWSINCDQGGVCRDSRPAAERNPAATGLELDTYDVADGLSGLSMTVLNDREGNLWVGTKNGLDRFRKRALRTVEFDQPALYFAMVPEPSGGLWLGTASMGFRDIWRRLDQGKITPVTGLEPSATVTYRDRDGSILVGGPDGLWRFDGQRFTAIEIAPAQLGSRVQAITRDGQGRLWVAFRNFPAFELKSGKWIEKGGIRNLPDLAPARAVTDQQGRAWLGYLANRLVIVDGTLATEFGEAQGLDTGTVTAILPGMTTSFVGGEQGLSIFDGRTFKPLHVARPELLKGITGLLRTADGTLWINGIGGALRISAAELALALRNPAHLMSFRLFDASDGMPGGAQQARPLPTIVETVDGKLWFAAASGLAWLAPDELRTNAVAPPMAIRYLRTDEKSYSASDGLRLPSTMRELQIGFSALQFAMPEKLSLRYRLVGYDQQWQEAGTRREAFYTNLPPGHYRFEVTGGNEDGTWSRQATGVSFDIEPAFHQTSWFLLIAVILTMAALWLLYRVRLAQSRRQIRQDLKVRQGERERIARDIHDTLLQGVQGLVLRLQTWAANQRVPPEQREEMAAAAIQAREVLVEGRDRIISLRRSYVEQADLAGHLQLMEEEFSSLYPATVLCVSVAGAPRRLMPETAKEVIDIAREAIRNAYAHAQANSIEVIVTYASAELAIRIEDDGIGVEAAVLRAGGRAGHWGLPGMHERAARLGGDLAVSRRASCGTTVELRVPAGVAYLRGR